MYILIITLLAVNYHGGSAIAAIEFSTKAACEAAAQAYKADIEAQTSNRTGGPNFRPRAICMPKLT